MPNNYEGLALGLKAKECDKLCKVTIGVIVSLNLPVNFALSIFWT